MIKAVAVISASYGPHRMFPEVDPYWDAPDWGEAARGDGRGYGGVLEWIRPGPGETQADVLARAERRAREH